MTIDLLVYEIQRPTVGPLVTANTISVKNKLTTEYHQQFGECFYSDAIKVNRDIPGSIFYRVIRRFFAESGYTQH